MPKTYRGEVFIFIGILLPGVGRTGLSWCPLVYLRVLVYTPKFIKPDFNGFK